MDARPIGVFDSGLGGLTIVRALVDLLPDERLVYFGDTARFPYGPRSPQELRRFSTEIVDLLFEHDVKMVVVACNSASSAALEHLRATYTLPIIGVIDPAVRAASEVTAGKLGVIGTEATIGSGAYERAVDRMQLEAQVTALACPGFVELVESGDLGSTRTYGLVARTLAPLRVAQVDTLILGCTHYPHLSRAIGDVMGREVMLVSSAEETAFEVRNVLGTTGTERPAEEGQPQHTFLTSGDERTFTALGGRLLGEELQTVEGWSWPSEPAERSA